MRSALIFSLAMLGLTQNALAADPADDDTPFLRGSEVYEPPAPKTYTRWSGFYAGGQVGYSNAKITFGTKAKTFLTNDLGSTPLPQQPQLASAVPLAPDEASGTNFGAFAGYNTQWEDVILGGELTYNRMGLSSAQANSASPSLPVTNGIAYNATVSASSSVHLTDYATIRGRAGYAMGSVLPYVTLGLAVGRADSASAASVSYTGIDRSGVIPPVSGFVTASENKTDMFGYGYAIGAGVDVMLMSRVFARVEWENVQFVSFGNQKISMNSVRAGLGVKF